MLVVKCSERSRDKEFGNCDRCAGAVCLENRGSVCQMMHVISASPANVSAALDASGEGFPIAAEGAQTADHVESVVSPAVPSGVASVTDNGFSNEVQDSLHPTLQTAEMRLTKALQHIYECTETRVLDALKQAAFDIIDHLGKQAAIQVVAAERRSAVLEQELKNTRSQALDMLVRMRYSAHVQRAEDQRRVLMERKRALEADAKLQNVQETVKRAKAELKRKSEMLEELQKRVQLEDTRASQSASEGLDHRKGGSRTKAQVNGAHEMQVAANDTQSLVEELSDQLITLPGTQVSTADSVAFKDADARHPKRQRGRSDPSSLEDITPEPESRVRARKIKWGFGSDGSADCSNAVSAASDEGDLSIMNGQGPSVAWMNKAAGTPGIEQHGYLEVGSSRGEMEAIIPCGEMCGQRDRAGEPGCIGTEPVSCASKDLHRSENGGHCGQMQDESILKCREPGICPSDKPCQSEGHQVQVQALGQDCSNLMCLEQGDGLYGLVNYAESDKSAWRATFSPPSTSRPKSSPTNFTEQLAVSELDPGSKTGVQASSKRKRKEKVTPDTEVKRVENVVDCRKKSGTCLQDVAGRLTESSRESRRLMQGARQLFSLRRGRDAD